MPQSLIDALNRIRPLGGRKVEEILREAKDRRPWWVK